MHKIHYIDTNPLDLSKIKEIISTNMQLALSETAIQKIEKCRNYLDKKTKFISKPIYGINTGFGSLYNVKINDSNLQKLQENLVMSHACGMGDEVPPEIVKLMILFKIKALSYGHSGVQLATVNRLIDFYNNNIIPVVFTQGSLGASGDLSPLAHLALPLIGLGEVYYQNKKIASEKLLNIFSWETIKLQSKEGLALLNGTQFMS
ncbi:MAG: aromatic amino acid lyase, partial [Polaribacter sp.]